MLAARVMGWLGEQQWLLPCWKCDSFSSTSFLVLLFQSHTERCLKHPGAVTGGWWRQLEGYSLFWVGWEGSLEVACSNLCSKQQAGKGSQGCTPSGPGTFQGWSCWAQLLHCLPSQGKHPHSLVPPAQQVLQGGYMKCCIFYFHEVLYFLFTFPYECTFVCIVDTSTLCCSRYEFVTTFCFQSSLAGLNHQKYHIF